MFPKQHLARHGRHDVDAVVHVRGPLAVTAELEIVVEQDICKKRLQLVRREEPSRAATT